jgi:hypothetical protein
MAKVLGTLAEALGLAHKSLLADLGTLEATVQPTTSAGIEVLRSRLASAHTRLVDHFRLEEENGYMDAVRKREPRLEKTIELLAREHRELLNSLANLTEQANNSAAIDGPLRSNVRSWVEAVRRHEHQENELVQTAFNMDLTAED